MNSGDLKTYEYVQILSQLQYFSYIVYVGKVKISNNSVTYSLYFYKLTCNDKFCLVKGKNDNTYLLAVTKDCVGKKNNQKK